MNTITVDELKAKMDAQDIFNLIDLRSVEHYEHNHIVGAINIPYDDKFAESAEKILHDKGVTVVVYSDFEDKPEYQMAILKLSELGYTDVYCFNAGLHGWMEAGHRLEFGEES
ncbi:MAG: rhodanese-like domain-containing protein [Candidatus Uhrbacteria bacterium]